MISDPLQLSAFINLTLFTRRLVLPLALMLGSVAWNDAYAGLVDDWLACKQDVLPRLHGQSPSDAPAQYCMGLGYMTGQLNGQRDRAAAAQWFARAAEQGHAGAEVALGYDYEKGYGVGVDAAQAVAWYRKAAAQGSADGLFNLGRAHQNGIGVTADATQAHTYYTQAAARGSKEARQALDATEIAYAQAKQRYDAKDETEGSQQMLRAAQAGNAQAQFMIGNAYEFGNGVAVDLGQAAFWYEKAANQGHAKAQKNLGSLYESGNGVTENWALAVALYRKSAEQHDADGEFALGRMYEFGMGVPQDRRTAIQWFERAADLGHARAKYFARWLGDSTNSIGFRDDQEHQRVIGSKLRFAGNLTGGDPAGITFNTSAERLNWLNGQSHQADYIEAHTMWQMRKNDYDQCISRRHRRPSTDRTRWPPRLGHTRLGELTRTMNAQDLSDCAKADFLRFLPDRLDCRQLARPRRRALGDQRRRPVSRPSHPELRLRGSGKFRADRLRARICGSAAGVMSCASGWRSVLHGRTRIF